MDMFEQDNNIYKDYKQDEKPSKKKIVTIVVISVLVLALVAGRAFFGGTLYSANSTVESEMPMVKTVLDALNKYYINDIDWEQFQYAVAEAVAGSVDRFTGLVEMTPTGVKSMSMGITFGYNDYCNYYISEISPVSPAAKAVNVYDNGTSGNVKLKVGDEVVALNGYTIQHLNSASFSQLLSTLGNTVRLDVVRRNADGNVSGYYTYKIDKEMFHSPLAYYLGSDVTGLPSNVGYIRLNEFSDTAPDDFAAAVKEFLADENRPNKLVLDLRGNGGGAVTMCGFIASYFVSQNGTTSGIPMAKYVYNAGGGDKQETCFYTQDTYVSDLTGETIKSVNLYDEGEGFDCVRTADLGAVVLLRSKDGRLKYVRQRGGADLDNLRKSAVRAVYHQRNVLRSVNEKRSDGIRDQLSRRGHRSRLRGGHHGSILYESRSVFPEGGGTSDGGKRRDHASRGLNRCLDGRKPLTRKAE